MSLGQPRTGMWKYPMPDWESASRNAVLEKPFFRESGNSRTSTTVWTPALDNLSMKSRVSIPSYPMVWRLFEGRLIMGTSVPTRPASL